MYLAALAEDCKLHKKNIYLTYVDFANAFGSVQSARLVQMLRLQGIPEEIVKLVDDLYDGATTRVRTPVGTSEPLPITCGTIQGETLSPVLFLLFLEPFLQWLQAGEHGYVPYASPSCPPAHRPEPATNSAFCDDLALISGTTRAWHAQPPPQARALLRVVRPHRELGQDQRYLPRERRCAR
jgi:hypothetical protein